MGFETTKKLCNSDVQKIDSKSTEWTEVHPRRKSTLDIRFLLSGHEKGRRVKSKVKRGHTWTKTDEGHESPLTKKYKTSIKYQQ